MPQELYQELLVRLAKLRRKQESVALSVGLFSGLTVVVLVWTIAILAEMLGHFSIPVRTAMFWSALALSLGGLIGFSLPSLLVRLGVRKRATDDDLAMAVGRHYPVVSDRLVNTLQLARPLFSQSSEIYGSPRFALAAFETTYHGVRDINFNAIVDERPRKRAALLFFFSFAVGLALFVAMGSEMSAAANRLTHFRTFYQKPAPFTLILQPGNVRAMRGDSVRVVIVTRGEQLAALHLHVRQEGQKEFDAIELKAEPLDSSFIRQGFKTGFIHSLLAQHPLEYYAEAREIESQRFHVTVLDHPIIRSLSVTVNPPSYTGEKSRALSENIGDIAGVAGTRGDFRVVASNLLRGATLVFQATPVTRAAGDTSGAPAKSFPPRIIPLLIRDSIATGSVAFLQSGSYHIDLLDRDSVASEHPIEYTVTVTNDEPPTIALIEPADRSDLPSDQRLDMLARVHDDFGFRSVRLGYRISKSKYLDPETTFKWLDVPLANHTTQDLDVPYIWNLTPLGLAPEDEVSYVMEVTDNDGVTGPKSARTPEYTLRLPSVKEIFDRADAQANKSEKDLKEIQQDAGELQKKISEALNEMKQMKSSDIAKQQQDFSKQKDMQQIMQRQQKLNARMDQVAKDLEQMTKQLDQQQAISPETMQKYQELQKLFEQIQSPELKEAMKKLEQAMKQNVDPKQLQEAMKNMQLNEEQFKKQIERTANILKKIQAEQKVDELMKRSTELAKQEQKAADLAAQNAQQNKPMTPEDQAAAARQQEDAKKELERMQQDAKQLAEQMKKLPENMQSPEEMQAAMQALSDPSMQSSMDQAQQAMQKGQQQRGSQHAQDAANKMKNASRKLSDLKKKMSENERQRAMREMKQLRDELNRLSKDEEQIKNQARQAQPNSNVFRDLAEQQSQKKDQLGQTASKAMQMAQRSTAITPEMGKQMGDAFANMQKAQDAMTDRNQQAATQNAQNAMSALNKAAQQMQSAMQAMAQQGQGSGGSGGEGEEGQSGQGQGQGQDGKPGSQGSAMQQFLNQINQLTSQQQALNNQMQAMAQGQGGTQAAQREMMRQQAEMSKIAAQQQAVQKSLQDLAAEQKQSQQGQKLASDELRQIADEMQQVISDMKSGGIRPETVQRQERILSRLLEAQRSVHERDKDQQRESKPGEQVSHESARELDLAAPESKRQLQDELQHSKETGYSKDYNTLIRKYFESLEKAGQK